MSAFEIIAVWTVAGILAAHIAPMPKTRMEYFVQVVVMGGPVRWAVVLLTLILLLLHHFLLWGAGRWR